MKTQAIGGAMVQPQWSRIKSPLVAPLTFAALAIGAFAVAAALLSAPFYRHFIDEDGAVETASWLSWLGAVAALGFWLSRNRGSRSTAMIVVLMVFCFLCGGEEASWGQRILGFKTPAALHVVNKQDETNLHNIGSISAFSNGFFLLATLFFLLPRWAKMRGRYPILNLIDPDATRIYLLGLATWVIIGLRFGTLGFSPLSLWGYYSQMDDEIYEFFAAFSFFAFALLLPSTAHQGEPLAAATGDSP